ncbi:MAG TPA: hypothetical protein VK054_13150 [Beutenbergiaceae bacterium]|nr:hypothetical protein [Beutenbergiaceae bacterium]
MTTENAGLKMRLKGAPTVSNLKEAASALSKFIEGVTDTPFTLTVTLNCDSPTCGETTPFDLAAGEQAIWDVASAGWTRDPADNAHYCPDCSHLGSRR